MGEESGQMKRNEAVALLKELGAERLLRPSSVLVEQRTPDRYQLCFKGDFDFPALRVFVKRYNLEIEENTANGICIFKL
jgi:hypothetical protein